MFSTYIYRAAAQEFRITKDSYEARLTRRIRPGQLYEWDIFSVHSTGIVIERTRGELLDNAQRYLALLLAQESLIQFHYALTARPNGGRRGSQVTDRWYCIYLGGEATALAGPGHCRLDRVTIRVTGHGTLVERELLHDLRDMLPLRLDDGTILTAKRKPRPVDLVAKMSGLVRFLEAADGDSVLCSVVERRTHPDE